MGQKISIELFRAKQKLANSSAKGADITSVPSSVWFADDKSYSKVLLQDMKIREYLNNRLETTGLAAIHIRRYFRKIEIVLHSTKPGLIIGKGGSLINQIREDLIRLFKLPNDLKLSIEEYRDPNRSAMVIAQDIAYALKKKVPFRKVCKNYMERIKYSGILGAKITIKGRLNGAEIARKEEFGFGSVPRHTIDAQIDRALVHCQTFAGTLGVTVLLYKGDKLTNYTY